MIRAKDIYNAYLQKRKQLLTDKNEWAKFIREHNAPTSRSARKLIEELYSIHADYMKDKVATDECVQRIIGVLCQ